MSTRRLLLEALAERFPDAEAAAAEVAGLTAQLAMPRPITHVISDIHGEFKKLRHVVNNASGSLRPLVAELFGDELDARQQQLFLTLIYYPREVLEARGTDDWPAAERRAWVRTTLERLFILVRHLAGAHRGRVWESLTAPPYRELFREFFNAPTYRRPPGHLDTLIDSLARFDLDLRAVRRAARLVRHLSVAEIVVGGDLGDRGARLDRVIEFLMHQPKVSITWGNHDISWLGACIGQEALMATVLRMSLRYLRLWQLEEGYGIILSPLEKLVRDCYADDPAGRFLAKRGGTTRPPELVARMQKACAILQCKLEAATIARHPEWGMHERIVLDRVDFAAGTLRVGDRRLPLADARFPTVDPADPAALHPAERECLERLRQSFLASPRLWHHMRWVVENGGMSVVRDHGVIFHACVPVDEDGRFLELEIDGRRVAGRAMLDAFERVVHRAYAAGGRHASEEDKDWLYYLWAGPRSPLFGKDRMATFESYFLDDPEEARETKNAYFRFLHDHAFADRIAREFGVAENGLVINGHIPVRPEKGESPVKQGGNAVTIDGAFSEAYGDRGYTLILAPDGVFLAEHHHFDSVADAIEGGADIVPRITTLCHYPSPRTIGDTPEGEAVRARIRALGELVAAYREGSLRERVAGE